MNSTDKLARLTGILYLIMIVTGGVGYTFGESLIGENAAASIANIQAGRNLLEIVIVLGAFGTIATLMLALAFYRLFSRIDQVAATVLLVLLVVAQPLALAGIAQQMNVLSLLDGAPGLPAPGSELWQAQIMLTVQSARNLTLVSTIFWGLWLIPLGWLVYRSGFIPRVLGILLMLGSITYVLTFSGGVMITGYLDSLLARVIFIATGVPSGLAEIVTALWLIVRGARPRGIGNQDASTVA